MIYTLEKINGSKPWYELTQYNTVSKYGILSDGQVIANFNTFKEAKAFCQKNNINYVKGTTPKGCKW